MKVFIPNSFIINAMAKEQYMISLESVSLDIDNTQIFSDLNLCVKENEKFLIQGRSGMGKTSLFRLILGFEQPQSGQILVNGLPLDKNHITRIRQQIFYLSQDIDLKNEIIIRLLTDILELYFPRKAPLEEINKFLAFLELSPDILQKKTKDISGGERQRIGLLIGFLLDRPIWLLDEPTSALDDAMKEKISSHILSLDKTIIIISHDPVWKNNSNVQIKRWS
jgi:putative ABC transport system ATP-binding protein